MKTHLHLSLSRWPAFAALLVLVSISLPSSLRAEADSGRDAAVARCLKILNYGEAHGLAKPTKTDAVIALGLLGDETVVPVLIDHLKNEPNDQLRMEIVRALSWIGGKTVVPALEEALHDKYLHTRSRAAAALKDLTGKEYTYDHTGEEAMKRALEDLRALRAASEKKAGSSAEPAR